jgi:tryptophanyl-tRNA synthetase
MKDKKEIEEKIFLDPWGSVLIEDYTKLLAEFGIEPFTNVLDFVPNPHRFMRRNIIFGHRDYQRIAQAIREQMPFAVMSGFMPSGKAHFGNKMVMEEIIWHQKSGGDAYVGIADMEAHSVRGISWNTCKQLGIEEYVLNIIALGLEEGAIIYFQSRSRDVRDLAFELGIEANFSELKGIYGFSGETTISHMVSVIVQCADILMPQLGKYDGPKPVVVPVGPDQDPHLRLTRDLATRTRLFSIERKDSYIRVRSRRNPELLKPLASIFETAKVKIYEGHIDVYGIEPEKADVEIRKFELKHGGTGFILPSSTYHRFMSGLTGGKMSSSNPESYIAMNEKPDEGYKKIMRAKTGGRVTVEEQRKLGGVPESCSVYEMLLFHLVEDDKELAEIYSECRGGRRICGTCKKETAERLSIFLKNLAEGREEARERLKEYHIIM